MAAFDNPLLRLKLVKERAAKNGFSEMEVAILHTFSLADPNEVAYEIDYYCPLLDEDIVKVEDYIWVVWDIMICITSSPDVTYEIQAHFIAVLRCLSGIAKGEFVPYTVRIRFIISHSH